MSMIEKTEKAKETAEKIASGEKASLFLDLDGTLWHAEQIPDSAREALFRARANGHHVYFCTGRPVGNVPWSLYDLRPDGLCCSAGMNLMKNKKQIASWIMPMDLVQKAVQIIQENHLGAAVATNTTVYEDELYAQKRTEYLNQSSRKEPLERKPFCEMPKDAPVQKLYYDGDQPADMEQLFKDEDIDVLAYMTHYNPLESIEDDLFRYRGELTWSAHNKAEALQTFMQLEDRRRLSLAFGDSENDLSMLKAADLAVSMGNGTDPCKEAADLITERLDQDGLYKAFEFLNLI